MKSLQASLLSSQQRDRLIEFMHTAMIGMHWISSDGVILWANAADYTPLGYTADEYIGSKLADFHKDAQVLKDMFTQLNLTKQLKDYPARLRCKNGSIREVRITANASFDDTGKLIDVYGFTRDVTAEVIAEERTQLIAEANELLSSSLDFEATLASLARLCVPRLADWCAVELLTEDGNSQQLAVAHVNPEKIALAQELRRQYPPDPNAARGVCRVLRTGEPEYLEEIPDQLISEAARSPDHERMLRSLGLKSYIVVPIALRGRILGALTLVQAESKRRYQRRDVLLAQELASRAAQAIEHACLYRDANQARKEAEDVAQRFSLLARLSAAIAPSLQPKDALKQLARFVVSTLADYCIAYTLDENGSIRRAALAHTDPKQQSLVEDLTRAGPPQTRRSLWRRRSATHRQASFGQRYPRRSTR